jgi:hypothetical protein
MRYDARDDDGYIIDAGAYPYDDKVIALSLQYTQTAEEFNKRNFKFGRFFIQKVNAHLLLKSLSFVLAANGINEAWDEIARQDAANCDPGERVEKTVEDSALEIMNPPDEELIAGDQAIQDLVAHLKRMKAAGTTQHVPDVNGEWVVNVEWKPIGKVN